MVRKKNISLALKALLASASVSAMMLGADGSTTASSAAEIGLEEITVTARKREESWKDVPVAVSAFTADSLISGSVDNSKDLVGLSPSLFVTYGDMGGIASSGFFVIRGVGATPVIEPAVGTFIDGVYQTALSFDMAFLDVERIEVLRGPQGTIFGRNTQGGALNIVTKKPSDTFEGKVSASYDEFETVDLQSVVSGPVADHLTFSVAGRYRDSEGYYYNPVLDIHQGAYEDFSGRARVFYDGEAVDADLIVFGTDWKGGNLSVGTTAAGVDEFLIFDSDFQKSTRKTFGGSLRLDIDLDGVVLTSISSYAEIDNKSFDDTDAGPAPGNTELFTYGNDSITQEIRVGSDDNEDFFWSVGAFYFNEDRDLNQNIQPTPNVAPPELLARPLTGMRYIADTIINREGYAFFGQFDYNVNDSWAISGGLRYSDEKAKLYVDVPTFEVDFASFGGVGTLPLGALLGGANFAPPYNDDASFNQLTWTGSVTYAINEVSTAYATVAKGFKAGGYQDFIVFSTEVEPFDNEVSTNYELGLKASLFDNRVNVNLSAYYIDISNQQIKVRQIIGTLPSNLTLNIGSSHTQGFEFESTALLAQGLKLDLSLGYVQEAGYDKVGLTNEEAGGLDVEALKGTRFANVPKVTASAALDYVTPVTSDLDLHLYGNLIVIGSHVTSYSSDPTDAIEGLSQKIEGYELVNLSASIKSESWTASLFVTNLFDKTPPIVRGFSPLITPDELFILQEPRKIGARIEWRF